MASDAPIVIEIQDKIASGIQQKIENIASAALAAAGFVDKLRDALSNVSANSIAGLSASVKSLESSVAKLNTQMAAATTGTAKLNQAVTGTAAATRNATKEINAATGATTKLGKAHAGVSRELLVLTHELSQGNYKRFGGSLLVLGEQLDVLKYAANPAGAAILALTAIIAGSVYAFEHADAAYAHMSRTLQSVGGYTGATTEQVYAFSAAIAAATNETQAHTREIAQGFAATGELQSQVIQQFTYSTIKLAQLTGKSTDDIQKQFEKAAQSPAKFAEEMNRQYHFLSAAELEHLREMEDSGHKTEALERVSQDLYNYLGNDAPIHLTTLEKGWRSFKATISDFFNGSNSAFSPTNSKKIIDLQEQLAQATAIANYQPEAGRAGPSSDAKALAQQKVLAIQSQIKALQDQDSAQVKLAKDQADKTATQQLAANADAAADHFLSYANNTVKLREELDKLQKTIDDLQKGNPNSPKLAQLIAQRSTIEEAIRKAALGKAGRRDENYENTRAAEIAKVTAQYAEQAKVVNLVGDARERMLKIDALDEQLKSQNHGKGKGLSDAERSRLDALYATGQDAERVGKAADAVYQAAIGPARDYDATIRGITLDLKNHNITQDEANKYAYLAGQALASANDPLYNYNKGLSDSEALLSKYGPDLEIATQLQQLSNEQLAKGNFAITAQLPLYEARLRQDRQRAEVQAAVNSLYADSIGKTHEMDVSEEALGVALSSNIINLQEYRDKMRGLNVERAQDAIAKGNGTAQDAFTVNAGKLLSGYTNVLAGLTSSFNDFFTSLEDGFANSIGAAVVHAKSLKQGLQEVSQTVAQQLISSLIKLGIQYALNAALGDTLAVTTLGTTTAASAAAAAATATAWATPAALVNAATFGAGAAAGDIALAASIALAQGFAATSAMSGAAAGAGGGGAGQFAGTTGYATGGYTGMLGTDRVAGVVHGQEYVLNAAATARNRGTLDAMNAGATVGTGGMGGIKVEINNYGTSKEFEVQQIDETRVRIIARDEVAKGAPRVVANDISQPNGTVSKAINTHTTASRRRA
jgi:hypothetical protein